MLVGRVCRRPPASIVRHQKTVNKILLTDCNAVSAGWPVHVGGMHAGDVQIGSNCETSQCPLVLSSVTRMAEVVSAGASLPTTTV